MPEQYNEKPETLAPKSKTEVTKSTLDTKELAEKQMEAKLNLLEDAVLAVGKTNPEYKVDDFYLGICELVYADEFPVSKIEKVVDLIDTYPFSKAGAKKFNDLTQAGDYVYLINRLENNSKCLDSLQSIDELTKVDLDAIRAVAGSLGELAVTIHGKGSIYSGKSLSYGDGVSSPFKVDVFYRDQNTSSNPSQLSSQEKMSGAIAATYFPPTISEEQEAFAEEMEVKGEEIEQANAALEEEYEATKEETGQTQEEFGSEIIEEFKAQNNETGITFPEFVAKRST